MDGLLESPREKSKRRSPIYTFFDDILSEDGSKSNQMQCRSCSTKIFTKSSNLEKHVKINHKDEYERFLQMKDADCSMKRRATDDSSEETPRKKKPKMRKSPKKEPKENGSRVLANQNEMGSYETEDNLHDNLHSSPIKQEYEEQTDSNGKLEFIGISGQPEQIQEEKFIRAVYPEFKGKTKLELIDEIRLLRDKVNVFKSTNDRMLDN